MPKRCPDPRCPINEYCCHIEKARNNYCKIHGKPSVTFAYEDECKNERGRKFCSRWKKRNEEAKRDRHFWGCCKNKKCQTSKYTIERATSTDRRPKTCLTKNDVKRTSSQTSRKCCSVHHHRREDKGRPCECARKRCRGMEAALETTNAKCNKGRKRHRSRRRKKRKYSWIRDCFIRFCICAKLPNDSMDLDVYTRSQPTLIRNRHCCCTYGDKHRDRSKSRQSKNRIANAKDISRREHEKLVKRCHCMKSIVNTKLPKDRSHSQGTLSRGFNNILKSFNICL